MKTFLKITFLSFCLLVSIYETSAKAGFGLTDSLTEFTLSYKTVNNLIILPVRINDNTNVNLILDTGCRNLILFGKRFQPLFNYEHGRRVQFSGMGSGKPVEGMLSLNNTVSIGKVVGESIPVIVVKDKNVTSTFNNVHGIIGYDIFSRFEIEINPLKQLITFRSSLNNYVPEGYEKIPMQILDSKPIIRAGVQLYGETSFRDLLLDTGSSLELLIKSTEMEKFKAGTKQHLLGTGLNGFVNGFVTTAGYVKLDNFEIQNLHAGIIYSPRHNHASIGMGTLKNYLLIINYSQAYTCLKKIA